MQFTEAAVLVSVAEPLQHWRLEIPELKPGQVLVDISFTGICHTQLHEVRGRRGPDPYVPHTLGHEGSGIVRAVGADVSKVEAGDRVVLTWLKGAGRDVPGTVYQSANGSVNSGAISTFMRTSVVAENRVIKIPDEMPLREAALLGCAVPTGAGMIFNTAKLAAGQSIAILGVGGIGLSAILAAKAAGASMIIAVDMIPHKLEQAKRLGATHVIDASRENLRDAVNLLTKGKGVDCAVEAAGRRETMEAAFDLVRVGGGRCIIAGNLPAGETISIDPMNLIKGRQIVGTWGGETQPEIDIPRYAALFLDSKFPIDLLITHEYDFGQINEALDDLEQGKVGRALVRMDSEAVPPLRS